MLKDEKTINKARQAKIADLEQKLIKLSTNPTDPQPIQELLSVKENEIQVIKNKLNIPTTEPVQTAELKALQEDKDGLSKQLQDAKHKIENMKGELAQANKEKEELRVRQSPVITIDPNADPSDQLADALKTVSLKEDEVTSLKASVREKESEIESLDSDIRMKDEIIEDLKSEKVSLLEEVESLKGQVTGIPALVEARKILWDKIEVEVMGRWSNLQLMQDELELADSASKDIERYTKALGDAANVAHRINEILNSLHISILEANGKTNKEDLARMKEVRMN